MNGEEAPKKRRLAWIDGMLSILVACVILGHCMMPRAPRWYIPFHTWLYTFHMAGFFTISGLLAGYRYIEECTWRETGYALVRRLRKFGLPFVLLGTSLSIVIVVSRGGDAKDVFLSIVKLFLDTMASPVIYLWFVVVLMEYYLLAPLLLRSYRWSIVPAMLASFWLYYHPLPRFLCLHTFSSHLIFFLVGLIAGRHFESWKKLSAWLFSPALILFLLHTIRPFDDCFRLLVQFCAVCSVGLLGYLLSRCALLQPYLSLLGRCCYEIYLFQMIFLHILWRVLCCFPMGSNIRFIIFLGLSLPSAILPSIAISNNQIYRSIIGDKRGSQCA